MYHHKYFNSSDVEMQTTPCNADLLNWTRYTERKTKKELFKNEENLPIGFCTQKENQGYKNCFFDSLIKHLLRYYTPTRRAVVKNKRPLQNSITVDEFTGRSWAEI